MELVRNCSHGGEIATYVSGRGAARRIIKTSFTPAGIAGLRNELAGWAWYQGIRYPGRHEPMSRVLSEGRGFLSISIAFLEGKMPDYTRGVSANASGIEAALGHYFSVWGTGKDPCALHGDYSLGNMFFDGSGVHVADWEHFAPAAAPWGFDAVYLLLETLWFGMRGASVPARGELDVFAGFMRSIKDRAPSDSPLAARPARFMREFMSSNPSLWGGQVEKFPVMMFSGPQVETIDGAVR